MQSKYVRGDRTFVSENFYPDGLCLVAKGETNSSSLQDPS